MIIELISMFCDFIPGHIFMRIMAVFIILFGFVFLLELRKWLIDTYVDSLLGKDGKK